MASDITKAATGKALLTSLIDGNPLALVVLDEEGRVTLCNRAFESLFLFEQSEILGKSLDPLITTEEWLEEAQNLTARGLAGESIRVATRRIRKDGYPVDVEFHGMPLIVEGRHVGTFGLYQDITERIRFEHINREIEERFRRLAAATFEGLVIIDRDKVVDCNEQFAKMVGSKPRDIVGRSIYNFVPADDRALVEEKILSNYEWPYEHRAKRVDGTVFFVEVHAKSIPYEGREMRVTAVRDVTEQKQFQEEARQSQKMEAVGRLAGGIAHDFNNLLTVILGHCSMLNQQLPADSPYQTSLDEIRRAADQAGLMTRRLLAFGRKQAIKPESLDLNHVLQGMQRMLRRLIRADIDLVINSNREIGRVRADPGQLEQVILNLAINAGDAMPGGGTLTLSTEKIDDNAWHPEGIENPPSSWVLLKVSDTGVGMDSPTLDRLFEPFFTTKKKGKGTGLGLSTVYGIVKQSGGSILVDSRPGHGTLFRIFLPETEEEASEEPEEVVVPEIPPGSETVLVVEDEPGVRRLAVEFLELHGYRVLEAEDGLQGLERVRETEEIRLILTDVVMPGMSGPDMAEHVALAHPQIKILFMSGYDDGVLKRGESTVRAPMVQKPFSMQELVGKVREILDED